ncbi:phosphopantetheine-binding protein [Bacillus mobilis]
MPNPWDDTFEGLIRTVLREHPTDADITGDLDMFAAGLDSMARVELMLAVEEYYGIAIPDEMLVKETFSTPDRLWEVTDRARRNDG